MRRICSCTHRQTSQRAGRQAGNQSMWACCKFLSSHEATTSLPHSFTLTRRTIEISDSIRCQNTTHTHKINHRRLYLCTYANQTNSLKIESDVSIPKCTFALHCKRPRSKALLHTKLQTNVLLHQKVGECAVWKVMRNRDCVSSKMMQNICSLIGTFTRLIG